MGCLYLGGLVGRLVGFGGGGDKNGEEMVVLEVVLEVGCDYSCVMGV